MRRSFVDSLIVNLGAAIGALLGVLLPTAILRPIDAALVDTDQAFTWIPWSITVGAALGILAAMSLCRRADAVRVAGTYLALGSTAAVVAYPMPNLGLLIPLAPTVALLGVRFVREVSWGRSGPTAATPSN